MPVSCDPDELPEAEHWDAPGGCPFREMAKPQAGSIVPRGSRAMPGRVRPETGFHLRENWVARGTCPATAARSASSTTAVMVVPVSEARFFTLFITSSSLVRVVLVC
jgi:hypothetical protein